MVFTSLRSKRCGRVFLWFEASSVFGRTKVGASAKEKMPEGGGEGRKGPPPPSIFLRGQEAKNASNGRYAC